MDMLPNYIINRMTEDELRNYITHLHRVYESQRSTIIAYENQVEILERVYRHRSHLGDCLTRLGISQDCLADIQNELEEKYAKPDDLGTIGVCCDSEGENENE